MSLYADYLKEKTSDEILELDFGFATFRHIPDLKTTYIVDIYVKPSHRRDNLARCMADEICRIAKDAGHTKLLGSVVPSAKGSTDSLRVILAYGMRLQSSNNDIIFFEKDL